ncbi:hypothetical protein F4678DRAFT_317629 [Xylaria arbuscula]|nr:hypothetical protein F4678DRAFT_317629 [Xylaria arbuscula]
MCFYQLIHTTHHYALLSLDANEREAHSCAFTFPEHIAEQENLNECPLHSCCRVQLALVFHCRDADSAGALEVGKVSVDDERICERSFVEEVFVPVPVKDGGGLDFDEIADGEMEGSTSEEDERDETDSSSDIFELDAEVGSAEGSLVMEFWPDQGVPVVVRARPDDTVGLENSRRSLLTEPEEEGRQAGKLSSTLSWLGWNR